MRYLLIIFAALCTILGFKNQAYRLREKERIIDAFKKQKEVQKAIERTKETRKKEMAQHDENFKHNRITDFSEQLRNDKTHH